MQDFVVAYPVILHRGENEEGLAKVRCKFLVLLLPAIDLFGAFEQAVNFV
jgi:hypothetical protein